MTIAGSLLRALRILAFLSIGLVLPAIAHGADVTDVLGRKVHVPDHVSRIVLGESRLSYALALLDRDNPFQRVVGWQNDLRKLDPHTFETYKKKFPAVADIAVIGETSEVSVSVETILSLKPDLVIFSVAGEGPKAHSPIAETLAQAGIAVLYVDFRVSPIENTPKSITVIGEAIGRQAEAKEFTDFYARHLGLITSRVAALKDEQKPSVFLELLAGVWQAPGHTTGNGGLGQFVATVGGRNIAASVVPGAIGDVAVEYVLHADPDIYIATGNRSPGLLLGAGVDEEAAQKSLGAVLARPEFKELRAIRDRKAYGLWHDFYNSPYNILAIEALAKWIHPELFQDIDPAKTEQEMAKSLLAIDTAGTYWVESGVAN
ncbi:MULTISPECIES: ABC transporter substrate-binding protein [unclassified Rhizobium]|jgi:iron complex transport system substrate-binding protein|uniref:ABC transporter substrate-binding protein n=1 Tax=unclassified Rhizobium TaxID=2613769 RepID=UPI000648287F|nr:MULTISPECIES: ABC transporter substrate-binding protein [unclassified Rhizobium]MBN8950594.1 ABC transporter substrate-binding protein [Rhizobium tropici]OJY66144.1 MAG: iron ABC transporter substrate-binding protein [Rhizobium sp. 60-20]RKD69308.1 iron complex transport system substrate-binding protein [Rhizobium sp. WW_1]